MWEGVLSAGSSGVVGRLRLRHLDTQLSLDATLTLQTNVTRYSLPLAVYSGYLEVVCIFLRYYALSYSVSKRSRTICPFCYYRPGHLLVVSWPKAFS